MAYYRVYLVNDSFQILSSRDRDLLDAAKLADKEGRKEDAAARRLEASVIEQEIGRILEDNAEMAKQASVSGKPPDTSNPFPDWVQALIKELGNGTAKFDRMNAEYKVRTASTEEGDESDEEWAAFKAKVEKAANETPERLQWHTSHHVQCSIVFENEKLVMNDLERYLGENPEAATSKTRRSS